MSTPAPDVDTSAPIEVPRVRSGKLSNGMRVAVARQSRVARVHIRLRMPGGKAFDTGNANRARLMPEVLLAGTRDLSSHDIAVAMQSMGASAEARTGLDDLVVSGSVLSSELPAYLSLLAEAVWNAIFPREEVDLAKAQMAQHLAVEMSQPATIARRKLLRTVYGTHPYGRDLPPPESVLRIGPGSLRGFANRVLRPRKATLVVVGDVTPARAVSLAEKAFGSWRGRPNISHLVPPRFKSAGKTILVSRPGAVQTNIRIAGPAVGRDHPDYFKVLLANTIFGGYFSSRMVENIREEKGYTYSPRSLLEHHQRGSLFYLSADVGTEVTAPALMEIRYELTKMATTLPSENELESARRYLTGLTTLSIQTQSGIADHLDMLFANGLSTDFLKAYSARLGAVTAEDVREISARYLAPRHLTTVLVGDTESFRPHLEPLDSV